jgi:hypothetical protein
MLNGWRVIDTDRCRRLEDRPSPIAESPGSADQERGGGYYNDEDKQQEGGTEIDEPALTASSDIAVRNHLGRVIPPR